MAFGFDHTHRCSQRGQRGSGLEGLPPPCGQLTRCFSAVAELLVMLVMLSTGLNCRPERLRLAIHYRVENARASLTVKSSQIY